MADARLVHVAKTFGNTSVLRDINLTVSHGEFITFVGPSGSGKSTLLRVIAGLEPVSAGQVFINGRDMTQEPPKARNVAMVFQNYALYPHMTVAKNITFGMRMRKESRGEQEKALETVVSMLRLEGLLDRKPRELSGGQRQRVAMARAIVRTPDLFLMDEPLSNLDAKLRNEVRLSIMGLHKKLACTMVYVTHDQIEAMTMAHRIVVLDKGEVQQTGTPQELFLRPANMFTAGFMGTPGMNFISLVRRGPELYLPDNTRLVTDTPTMQSLSGTEEITLGIRPEHLSEASGETAPERVCFSTGIRSSEMLGSQFLIHTKNEGLMLRHCRENKGCTPVAGDLVRLSLPLAKAHFFDTRTGCRLSLPEASDMNQLKVS